ncbi:hypothetical protein EDC01DRAFT_370553 [Geopyxis carbonaria]|nr:hypothetical protein EDC01DRAFT_370553 [Geopyxis carbonaria]
MNLHRNDNVTGAIHFIFICMLFTSICHLYLNISAGSMFRVFFILQIFVAFHFILTRHRLPVDLGVILMCGKKF